MPVHDVDVRHDNEAERERVRGEAKERRLKALRGVDFCRAMAPKHLERLALSSQERP